MVQPHAAARLLLAFDFDHTIVDGNTDTWITRVLPEGLPKSIKDSYVTGRWTEYMQRVLHHLQSTAGVTPEALQRVLHDLPYTAGFEQLWQHLQSRQQAGHTVQAIILSDSNSLFIDWILNGRGHAGLFRDVYTNPAVVSDQGMLQLTPHHTHTCPTCPGNMCKRVILQQHLQREQQQADSCFDAVMYIGDGSNDLCPAQALRQQDVLFVRAGYALDKLLQDSNTAGTVVAEVVRWRTAADILQRLLMD